MNTCSLCCTNVIPRGGGAEGPDEGIVDGVTISGMGGARSCRDVMPDFRTVAGTSLRTTGAWPRTNP
ncbi:hypothetical protein N8703_04365 [Verrucomicrobia bacterium]|nr:hypothetical protein [Verrucomicrobiota bacterium]